jgi:hypothetical protein
MATMFPLITEKMLSTLGYNWSNTIFALLALAMAAVPTVEYHHAFRFFRAVSILMDVALVYISSRFCSFTDPRSVLKASSPRALYTIFEQIISCMKLEFVNKKHKTVGICIGFERNDRIKVGCIDAWAFSEPHFRITARNRHQNYRLDKLQVSPRTCGFFVFSA